MKKLALIVALFVSIGFAAMAFAADKPNGGKAEAVGKVAGGITGAAVGGARGGSAGAAAGQMAGEALGAKAGEYLDRHAEENQKSGRGGPNDPRYDPRTLFRGY
jgi:hypothetical protein